MDLDFVNILNFDNDIIEQVRNWRNKKNVSRYMYTNHEISKEEHKNWIEKIRSGKDTKAWIIVYKERPIGLAQLSNIDYKNKITEWGFYIADESVRGKGIGSAALYKLIEYVFNEMEFYKLKTKVLENNTTALNLYEKFGFETVEKLDKIQREEKFIDVFLMQTDKDKWNEIKNNLKKQIKIDIFS